MADRAVLIGGEMVRLVDNGDQTFSIQQAQGPAGTAAWLVSLAAGAAVIGITQDGGPGWTTSHFGTAVADMTGTVALTAAPGSTQTLRMTDIIVSNRHSAALALTIQEETSGSVLLGPYSIPSGGAPVQITTRADLAKTLTAGKRLMGVTDIAGTITVDTWSYSED